MENEIECNGWIIRFEMGGAYQMEDNLPTRKEIDEKQERVIIKTPNGEEKEPIYYGREDVDALRRRMRKSGLDDECVDRVLRSRPELGLADS